MGALGVVVLLLAERVAATWAPFPFDRLERAGVSTVMRAVDGTPLRVTANREGERLIQIEVQDAAPILLEALLLAEDRRFHEHGGVDPLAVARAAWSNLTGGRVVSGASTLTMQLARMAEPRSRTLLAKGIEAFRARQLERSWSKRQILCEYLNRVPLGGVRGFEAAAWRWFGKRANELGAADAATLVAMLPAPSLLSPLSRPDLLRVRRDRLLIALATEGAIDASELATALAAELPRERQRWPFLAPWFCDAQVAALDTTLDLRLQRQVEEAVAAVGDGGADGVAAVVVERATGAAVAWVGGARWTPDRVDAVRCRRDAGSTLKPLVVALALRDGVTAAEDVLADVPLCIGGWAPRNFDGTFGGGIALRDALPQSRNVPAVTLLAQVGLDAFRELLAALDIAPAERSLDLTAALGTVSVTPLELARAYARFADLNALLPVPADVRCRALALLANAPLPGLPEGRGIAWKTGTSSGRRDAWCVAVAARHVVVAWRGNLDGHGGADLIGLQVATPLCARIVAGL